jgi:hypothetical protein
MTNEAQEIDPRPSAKLLRIMLGPEEEWDDDATHLALELCGIDSEEAPTRLVKLIEREISTRTDRGETIPNSLSDVLVQLRSQYAISEGTHEAQQRMEQMFIVGKVPLDSPTSKVARSYRRGPKKLSKHDEDILNELSAELASAKDGE